MAATKKVTKVTKKGTKVAPSAIPTIKFPEVDPSDLWTLANDIENLSMKLNNIAAVAELLATNLIEMPESGVAWTIVDMAKQLTEESDRLADRCLTLRRPYNNKAESE